MVTCQAMVTSPDGVDWAMTRSGSPSHRTADARSQTTPRSTEHMLASSCMGARARAGWASVVRLVGGGQGRESSVLVLYETPTWPGDRLDVGWAIDVLHPLAQQPSLSAIERTIEGTHPVDYHH